MTEIYSPVRPMPTHVIKISGIEKKNMDNQERGTQDLGQTFRTAMQPQPQSKTQAYRDTLHKLSQSTAGWVVVTSVLTFVILYWINPPIVQNNRNDNDMSKPVPNYITLAVLSGLAGMAVGGFTWYYGHRHK